MMMNRELTELYKSERAAAFVDLGDELRLLQEQWDAEGAEAQQMPASHVMRLSEIAMTFAMGAIFGLALLGMIR